MPKPLTSKLGLYSHVMPANEVARDFGRYYREQLEARGVPPLTLEDEGWPFLLDPGGTIFDCRLLPVDFVKDTGAAVFEEMQELKTPVRLPYNDCYLEFADDFAVFCSGCSIAGSGVEDGVSFVIRSDWHADNFERKCMDNLACTVVGEFWNGTKLDDGSEKETPFLSVVQWSSTMDDGTGGQPTPEDFANVEEGARRLLAVLSLLQDRLLASEFIPDPAPKLNRARNKRGRLPVSGDRHVLTINVGAVRRTAIAPQGTHESPALHWRRGHWRILHRGSEFESRAWVRRCLVGDPKRGFIHKDYRVVWRQPMLEATA